MEEDPQEQVVYRRPPPLSPVSTHYCPGCTHGLIHKLIAEVIDELGIQDKTIAVGPVGCSVLMYDYFEVDIVQAAHGRAPATATGLKRVMPDRVVFTYQGDGDLAAIGIGEILWAATRGENITVFYINNAIYGMTGGQMAPTTLLEQKTTTTPYGRDIKLEGYPIKISEMLALTKGAVYIERTAVNSPANIRKTKKAIRKAFQTQIDDLGFSLVEILSPCPTNWRMTPIEAWQWIDKVMTKEYPLGVIKDITGKQDAD